MNRYRKNVVRLTESELRNVIKESVKQILKEASNTSNGYYYTDNEDWDNGNGYYQDDDTDYIGNWVAEPSWIEHNTNDVPKNARMIAQICEKLYKMVIKKVYGLDIDTHSNAYRSDSDLRIDLQVAHKYGNDGTIRKDDPLEALTDYDSDEYKRAEKMFEDLCKRRLQGFSKTKEVTVYYNTSLSPTIYIEGFKIDKNGMEKADKRYLDFYNRSQHINSRTGIPYSEVEY